MRSPRPIASLLVLILFAGLGAGCSNLLGSGDDTPTSPSGPSDPTAIVYAAVGASDAVAVGASVSCTPFVACPDGTGYVQIIARRLGATGAVSLTNLGIPAAVIGPDFQALGNRYGRSTPGNFLEREMPFVPRTSTIVTILAGPNDANVIAAAVEGGAGGGDPLGYIDAQVRAFAADYDTLVRGIRQRAPSAKIVVANLPNLAGLPFTAGHTTVRKQGIQKISVDLSTRVINNLTAGGVHVVDVLCDPRFYEPGSYSADGFHPNDRGYSVLADVMLAAIDSASHPAPRASCPQMTLVPPL
jgi:lysophospholipase L1-like esterase